MGIYMFGKVVCFCSRWGLESTHQLCGHFCSARLAYVPGAHDKLNVNLNEEQTYVFFEALHVANCNST